MPTVNPMRYAHSDGLTDVCFDENGRYILTGGSDGDIRIWDGIDDDDAISHRCGDKTFSIAIKGSRYFAATDTNTIQAYNFPEGTPDGILTRFTAPANHIVLNKTGKILVAGASDFAIKIVEVDNCSTKTYQGHEAPVLSVALDPNEEYLASSSCDGTVKIWKVADRTVIHSTNMLSKCSDVSLSKTLCRLCWEPTKGKVLYVPGHKEVVVLERQSWKKLTSITDPCFTEHVSVVAVSPDGKYLAAGGYDGWIAVFDLKAKSCVDKHRNEKGLSITAMAWNPKNNMQLVFCDNQGQLGQLTDISTSVENKDVEPSGDKTVEAGVFDDDDDFLVAAAEDGNISEDDGVKIAKPKAIFSDDDSMPEFPVKPGNEDDASSVTSEKSEPPRPEPRVIEGFRPTPLQRPFQSGSTPEHLTSRFMIWNAVGIIRQYNSEEENSIDIEFHDTSIHHAMHLINGSNFTIADLSMEAALLATEGDSDTPSKLTCMHFSSWDNNKEWSVTMPEEEVVQCVTLGEGWLAVATSQRNVRLFSVAGVQKEVFTIPGPVVCMCGHTSQLLIIYHRGMGVPGEQCLGVTYLDVRDWRREVHCEPLPLSPTATLNWAGFSAEGTPFFMDSTGIIRMFNRAAGKSWTQIANTRTHAKGKSDHYWIVSMHENPQQIRCIPCKGSRYPATLPRPAPVVLPFQVPLCELNTEKSQYEELLWRTGLLTAHFDQWAKQGYEVDDSQKAETRKPSQEALMKLFALSARSEREFRALEVCEMMSDQHTLQLAIKYSSRMRYMQLAQRISEMAVRKAEEEQAKAYAQSQTEDDYGTGSAGRSSGVRSYGNEAEREEEEATQDGVEEEGDMETEADQPSGPLLETKIREDRSEKVNNPFQARSNPFKVSSTPSQSPSVTKGTQIFDGLAKKKEKSVGLFSQDTKLKTTKKGSQQKLLLKKKADTKADKTETKATPKNTTPFDLWLEDHGACLREEHADLDEEEFSKKAAEQFRLLPRDEKQIWLTKSKEANTKSKENVSADGDNKKRKRDEEDDSVVEKKLRDSGEGGNLAKKPLGHTANSKLSGFAFGGGS
ncbi:WD repeat and HMG-box DNA-binding protein 1-like [Dreissena polymorpha]|uniref:WD repeat and HMG-box DNA-binding protein 1 n=1 Tax=Dreissena polymorpha TaxID=45954 RepID=A0A9D4L9G3_DREPO|nr:WD repeat and HMG-box DNA-binding protein 1-like [Dreissena polymorpha]KAH3854450.1 hypothetical protein DPMN_096992 [Dreissena polymorpha]